ncbi:hypothetical protein RJ639_011000 [Escallonia herrerae]|uniref:Transposase Tnp1/En/Spm-like domain-containing protein n=1 Tax=Escallonia herrerae TaxID=1293975 RepID=A0AA89APE0_9ASTE|nr:hypothetical protein RJ639_011000 [Escallonia herrerae]
MDSQKEMRSRARNDGQNMIEQSNVQSDMPQFDGSTSGQSNPTKGDELCVVEVSYNPTTNLLLPPSPDPWTTGHPLINQPLGLFSSLHRSTASTLPCRYQIDDPRSAAIQLLGLSDISEKNKNNQKEKKLVQTTGKESYALVRERKAQMNEKREKLLEGSQDVPSENDILAQVMGKDKYGRVRMYGLGVSQSDVWGRLPSRKQTHRIAMKWKANCEQMEERFNNRIDELKSMFLRHRGREESISETSSPVTSINHRPQITSTQLLRPFWVRDVVCLKSIMNPSETIAKGIIQSIDPSTQVGGEELGQNWCEVSIQVAVKKDELDTGFKVLLWEAIRAEKQRNESARQPGEFLIGKGTSWEAIESAMDESKPKTHKYGRVSTVP